MKLLLTTLVLLVSTMITHAESLVVKNTITPDTSVVYKTVGNTALSLHIFNPKGHQKKDQVPVIVFFYGGGWSGGTPRQFYEQSRYFAQKGMVAIAAEYRVNKIHGTTPFDAVTDAKSVIRWVREQAKTLGVNPNKIVASGASAGGHLALCIDVIEGYEDVREEVSVSSKPNALILYNPVLDTTEKGYGMDKVGEKKKTDISPNHHIKKGVVPTLIFHGKADKIVPYENAERFYELMKESGNDCQLESYEGKGHGFFNGSFFRGKNADKTIYTDVMEKSYAFIKARFSNTDVNLANLFSDHMVLQRGMKVPIWGSAEAGQKVSVAFAGQLKTTITDAFGKWKIQLDTLKTSKTGSDLIVSGKKEIVISDVLVGEVWICSGQSNMQVNVKAVPDIQALVDKAKSIRSFEATKTVSLQEEDEVKGTWSKETPVSAVAFAFAYYLEDLGNVPIGIIHSSWGSSSIEAWMPRDMTKEFDYFKTIMRDFDADTVTQNRIKSIIKKQDKRTRAEDVFIRRQPNILFNAMMKPLMPYAVRGLVWYQGERNTRYLSGVPTVTEANWFHRVAGMKEYGEILKVWVKNYRKKWHKDDMHFMVVMLPGYGKGAGKEIDPEDPTEASWAWMRESQLKVLKLPHTSVINTIDLGDLNDIHPKDKRPIGERLALEAAKETLGKHIVAEGPIMKNVEVKNRKLVVSYLNADGLKTTDGKSPTGFWIADNTKQWKPAKTKIKGQTVILSSNQIKNPLYIRYAFSGKPKVNLVNGATLPAYPFRTDSEN
ncbi:sialate O-acetylesterase [Oceanihabitans sp. 2_MG-2023]|uniref:alpha/beta hydrolase fold domain-containing protein n=1 Tax=Oceanihabitans sp. 2_MG-2023 TaxID=3062661 RepID=UPI0026E392F2|nr:alpha/beta hydrolase fold domain-containing protein [Oceanihabitans sp. 2_MG-2023]MDO6597948.1 sialate O-acetylesterase [Oceanihabitans sp. 2_MG-2023]